MPYLMLEFTADREMHEEFEMDGNVRFLPSGREKIKFRMIDTDTGKVVELEADASNVVQQERPANWGEATTASQVLGETPGQKPSRSFQEKMANVEAERDSYRQKLLSAETAIKAHIKMLTDLEAKIDKLKAKQTSPLEDELIAAALDGYIPELAANQQFSSYEDAKKLYRRLTGSSWANEDGDDDDEEGDSSDLSEEDEPKLPDVGHVIGTALDFLDIPQFTWKWDEVSDPIGDLEAWAKKIRDLPPKGLPQYRFTFRDRQLIQNVKNAQEQMLELSGQYRRAQAQVDLYNKFFLFHKGKETRIPNFKLATPPRQIPKSKRDVVEPRQRWRADERRRRNSPRPGR